MHILPPFSLLPRALFPLFIRPFLSLCSFYLHSFSADSKSAYRVPFCPRCALFFFSFIKESAYGHNYDHARIIILFGVFRSLFEATGTVFQKICYTEWNLNARHRKIAPPQPRSDLNPPCSLTHPAIYNLKSGARNLFSMVGHSVPRFMVLPQAKLPQAVMRQNKPCGGWNISSAEI